MTEILTEEFAMGREDGFIKIIFPKPVTALKMDPQEAKEFGISLAKESYKEITGSEGDGKVVITRELEVKLITRLTLMIKNFEKRKIKHDVMAVELMGAVLREVT